MTNNTNIPADVKKVLNTGVKVYDLNYIVDNDFSLAQSILDGGTYTDSICATSAYNERVDNNFVGAYECNVETEKYSDYRRLCVMVNSYVEDSYFSYEEWKTNKKEVSIGRYMKLGKWFKKKGVDQNIIDFYSAQNRSSEEKFFFTITDRVQHIVGMTYNSDGSFSSCQNPDSEQSIGLAGSLHDNKLLVGMLHKSLSELEDMEDCLQARVVMRIVHIDGKQHLIPSRYYGDTSTKDTMDKCLSQLEELHIHSRDIRDCDYDTQLRISESANGSYNMYVTDSVWIEQTIEEEVECECPMCGGSGDYEVWSDRLDKEVEVTCPACGGSGTYETHVYIEIDEHVEVEDDADILPYTDDYNHNGYEINIMINAERLKEHNETYPN